MELNIINFFQLLLSGALGALIGLEREKLHKAAGVRTCALVTLGSTLFTIISQYGFSGVANNPSQIAGQVVMGVGFLGAGLIIYQRGHISGLTTAAALWVAAAIGMCVGVQFYILAFSTTIIALIILHLLPSPEAEEKKLK